MVNRKIQSLAALAVLGAANAHAAGSGPATGDKLAGAVLAVLVGLTFTVGLLALLFLFAVLRPQRVQRGSARVRTAPGRCLLVGTLGLVVFAAGFMLLGVLPKPLAALPFVLWSLVLLYLVITGLASVAHSIGERVQAALTARSLGSDAMAVMFGAVPLLGLGLLVGLGQLIQLIALLVGLGGVLSASSEHKAKPVAAAPPPVLP